jgi:hypothetical protein
MKRVSNSVRKGQFPVHQNPLFLLLREKKPIERLATKSHYGEFDNKETRN